MGISGSGKSTLANFTAHYLDKDLVTMDIFKVGHGLNSTTKGI